MSVCLRCGRKLTNKESAKRGYGPGCYKKIQKEEKRDKKDVNIDNPKREEIEGQLDLLKREAI
jgi:hypothetical protein